MGGLARRGRLRASQPWWEPLTSISRSTEGWNVAAIEPGRLRSRFHGDGAPAWAATVKKF